MSRAKSMLLALAVASAAMQAWADDDPEPPNDPTKSLTKIAKTMDDVAKRLKDGSVGEETQKLQERVLAQLDEALRREKARKATKGRAEVAAGLERVRALQERLGPSVKRVDRLGRGKERDAVLSELSQYQAKAAQMLRDVAAQSKPAR